jgi:hypothetical protein
MTERQEQRSRQKLDVLEVAAVSAELRLEAQGLCAKAEQVHADSAELKLRAQELRA